MQGGEVRGREIGEGEIQVHIGEYHWWDYYSRIYRDTRDSITG